MLLCYIVRYCAIFCYILLYCADAVPCYTVQTLYRAILCCAYRCACVVQVTCQKCDVTVPAHDKARHDFFVCPTKCTQCGLGVGSDPVLTQSTMAQHMASDCRFRAILCTSCKAPIIAHEEAGHNWDVCPVLCQLCDQATTRATMVVHLAEKCPQRPTDCELCGASVPFEALPVHARIACPYANLKCWTLLPFLENGAK